MLLYLTKRLFDTIIVICGLLSIAFIALHILPGDPWDGDRPLEQAVKNNLRKSTDLDKPLCSQYKVYMIKLVSKFDFGQSFRFSNKPVKEIVLEAFLPTVQLCFSAFVISVIFGIGYFMVSAAKNANDNFVSSAGTSLMFSIPEYVYVPVLVWFLSNKCHLLLPRRLIIFKLRPFIFHS